MQKTLKSAAVLVLGLMTVSFAQEPTTKPFKPDIAKLVKEPDSWFVSEEGKSTLANIVNWQNANGGWWKSYDYRTPRPNPLPEPTGDTGPAGDDATVWRRTSTIDNGATHSELQLLARAIRLMDTPAYRESFRRGLEFLFAAQYPTGGWPQRFPVEDNYGRLVTFNDSSMISVTQLMRNIASGAGDFAFVDAPTRARAQASFDRGLNFIYASQIKVNGKPTAWCQQHDPVTHAAAGARTYELPSITSTESVGILQLLMEIDPPDDRARNAIESGMAWFESAKITGKRQEILDGPQYPFGREKRLIDDPTAPPLWARFYDIETNKPFFCDRDGIKHDSMDQIGAERRAKYAWYTLAGANLEKSYQKWREKYGAK